MGARGCSGACAVAMTGTVLASAAFAATARVRSVPINAKATTVDVYPDRVTRFAGGITSLADVTY